MKYQISHKKEIQAAIDSLKKGKASDSNEIRAEDIKACDETTKEMIRQKFNEVLKQDDCTPETCQRFTNCSPQSYTTDFTAKSTKRNPKSREDLDVLT